MNNNIQVSVIIVNYNTKVLLFECLKTIFSKTKEIYFEVIIVDNNSSDGSKDYILKYFPNTIWVASSTNLGFGRANNLGSTYARGEYLFLLNSDTLLLNNAIKIFYDFATSHLDDKIGALGAWLTNLDASLSLSFGDFPSISSELKYIKGKIFKKIALRQQADVDYIIGADLFISKDIFTQVGGFDPNFFMYYEDSDLQLRISKLGLRRIIITQAQITHLEGGSFATKGLGFKRFMASQRSLNYYIYKNFRPFKRYIFRTVMAILRLTVFLHPWSFKEKIQAYLLTLKKAK